MAGVTVKNPIITPERGTNYLMSSHFQTAQDRNVQPRNMQSVFKHDYPPWNILGRPGGADPPPPAAFLHSDARYFNNKSSETTKQFQPIPLTKRELQNDNNKLRQTNFKMDADLSKFDSFHTTHNLHYPARSGGPIERAQPIQDLLKSNIPQGDFEKAPQPMSDYRDRFRGHDTNKHKIDKASNMHEGGPPTVKGDQRTHTYSTTHTDIYQGSWLPKIQSFPPPPPGSNIPQGDQEKLVTLRSTMRESYLDTKGSKPQKPLGQQQVTNFRLTDGHGTWQDYLSTAKQSYTIKDFSKDPFTRDKHRNHSDVPSGDTDAARIQDQQNTTTNRFYESMKLKCPPIEHKLPDKSKYRNKILSGANLRTKSNVWFGDPPQNFDFYDTTHESTYTPQSVPYSYNKDAACQNKSIIPLDYFPNEPKHAVTWLDFQNPLQDREVLNPVALSRLRASHIHPPLGGERHFSTQYVESYIPKSQSEKEGYDRGRLQKSSVPIGTLPR